MRFHPLLLVALLGVACTQLAEDDGEHDSFADPGKGDTGTVTEADACGVLEVVNQATATQLLDDVGLSSAAANNIVAYRVGDDEIVGTPDDQLFATLAELDAVPYVGAVAFGKLRTYAQANGFMAMCSATSPMCGGTETHTSTIANRTFYAPPRDAPVTVLQQLGKGWQGSVSFFLKVGGCSDGVSQRYTTFEVVDGNNTSVASLFIGGQRFEALKLPVTIRAPGISGGSSCSPSASIEQIQFSTIGTSCLPARVVRARYTDWAGAPNAIIGEGMMKTKLTFSAQAQFYSNYSAPHCGSLYLSGGSSSVTLTPAKPSTNGLVELESPIKVVAMPSCTSSRLSSPEATDADFKLTLSTFAMGVPL